MFLAQRMTTFNIHFENVTLPTRGCQLKLQVDRENIFDEKEQLFGKLTEVMSRIHNDKVWKSTDSKRFANVSRENLTRLLSAAQDFLHLQQDTFSNRPDYAKQWK